MMEMGGLQIDPVAANRATNRGKKTLIILTIYVA